MADALSGRQRPRRAGLISLAIAVIIVLWFSRYLATTFLDWLWWRELGQLSTWFNLLLFGTGPYVVGAVLLYAAFAGAFLAAFNRSPRAAPLFGFLPRRLAVRIFLVAFAALALLAAAATMDNWTVVRYFGGLRLPTSSAAYHDPIFGKPLAFYFFQLPFYNLLLRLVLTGAVLALVIHWLAGNADRLAQQLPVRSPQFGAGTFEFRELGLGGLLDAAFARTLAAVFLVALAVKIFFDRYELLLDDHGQYLVGVDWLADHVVIPLQWLLIIGALAAAVLILAQRAKLAALLLLLLPVRFLVPPLLASLYVRPNELALERPYIRWHIEATRSAFHLDRQVKEIGEQAVAEAPIDAAKHQAVLDNVRLWDWRAFHDTISQIQPLRPYLYPDTDVDRYTIAGRLRQVLIAPRELDTRQLGSAAGRWINTHLMYTHGYGAVMAEAHRITPDGLPVLFIKDAPPVVTARNLRLTRPEIYFSEVAHDPVYVHTSQEEFNYPAGAESKYTNYEGSGGFPVSSLVTRLAAALDYGDFNILLTSYLNSGSRMMIHRSIASRLERLAAFVSWDADPYLVVDDGGRLVWIVDGYLSSAAHPYARAVTLGADGGAEVNYIRNSVKATVDAYTGETKLYVFDDSDILLSAYARLFPKLFHRAVEMPADLRRHVRYPETLFNAQAEIYRTFHMRDPEAFYNRADLWDLAKTGNRGGEGGASEVSPTYVVAALPGSDTPEFMLITTFTPANKDNLIGVMYARCDGEHLGELQFAQLAKQNIIYGPMQIDARINQDRAISQDLTLWNQHGSQVLRGQTLVLPIENSFLYVEPIYIQSAQTSMPQLKKVALAMGNRLSYANTYEAALADLIHQLSGSNAEEPDDSSSSSNDNGSRKAVNDAAAAVVATKDRTLDEIRAHLSRYRDLSAQGKWAEAGQQLDEIQRLVAK